MCPRIFKLICLLYRNFIARKLDMFFNVSELKRALQQIASTMPLFCWIRDNNSCSIPRQLLQFSIEIA
jgi:hypothetical protein